MKSTYKTLIKITDSYQTKTLYNIFTAKIQRCVQRITKLPSNS